MELTSNEYVFGNSSPACRESPATAGLLFSGGLDSSILLAELVRSGIRVQPFYVRTGCYWEATELEAAMRFCKAMSSPLLGDLLIFEMPVDDLYDSHWSMSGLDVPDSQSPDEATYLLGRSPLLLLKPALWCATNGIRELAIGTLAANPFPDATGRFFRAFEAMIHEATAGQLIISTPLANYTKAEVIALGQNLPLHFTFSCLSPLAGQHCDRCNKCAERTEALKSIRNRRENKISCIS